MKKLLACTLLLGFASCASTADVADTSSQPACCAEIGSEACAEKMADCDAQKAECEAGKVCPVTGKTIN